MGTTHDYFRFAQMLANGGELDGVRNLGPRTVELMRSNHLPDGGELRDVALPGAYGEVGFDGMGFGVAVAVAIDQVRTQVIRSPGELMWGGAASTIFWVDPVEDLVCNFMTQPAGVRHLQLPGAAEDDHLPGDRRLSRPEPTITPEQP